MYLTVRIISIPQQKLQSISEVVYSSLEMEVTKINAKNNNGCILKTHITLYIIFDILLRDVL